LDSCTSSFKNLRDSIQILVSVLYKAVGDSEVDPEYSDEYQENGRDITSELLELLLVRKASAFGGDLNDYYNRLEELYTSLVVEEFFLPHYERV